MKTYVDRLIESMQSTDEHTKKTAERSRQSALKAEQIQRAINKGLISKKQAKKMLKEAKKELQYIHQQQQIVGEKLKKASSAIDDLQFIGEDQFNNMKNKFDEFGGIYIVSKKDLDNNTELTKFYDVVKGVEKPIRIKVDGLPTGLKGDDGLPVDTTVGALLMVTRQSSDDKMLLRFANVGPSTPEAQLQVEYALWKLGIGLKPVGNISLDVIDGQFRQYLTKKALED